MSKEIITREYFIDRERKQFLNYALDFGDSIAEILCKAVDDTLGLNQFDLLSEQEKEKLIAWVKFCEKIGFPELPLETLDFLMILDDTVAKR